ncbi:MAG: pyridoxal phosphate-dependent aminotransferase [Kiloniellales bacterium]|nr:pyridoxal phosphate-dependent aminotransferase [Kiloniellales bacterium]
MPDDLITAAPFPAPLRPEIEALETSGIAQVFELGLGRDDIVRLWVGEGDLPTPAFIGEAATRALKDGKTFYNRKRGIPELCEALARYSNELYGVSLDPERFTVTSSGMTGILLTLQTMVRPGDKVVVVSPVWPNIVSAVQVAGGLVEEIVLDRLPEGGFRLDLDRLMAVCDGTTRAVFVNSPGNPSGWVMPREEQQALLDFCRRRGLWLISDEVYSRFVYDRPASERPTAPSFLTLIEPEDPVIVVNSFSKTWAMTGWRMGWVIHPPSLAETFDRLVEFCTSGAPHFLQYGCIAALEQGEPFAQEMIERCRRGGELVYQRLSPLPRVRIARPKGSFYAFFAVDGLTDSLAFAKDLVDRAAVGLAPGSAFGAGGEGHLRLCFASSLEGLSEGLDRLEDALK